MLEDYARRNGLPNPTHFTDDGVSGTRFDRPGFLAMMEEVEAGRVEAIVIKDMSRLGRDYLKVGQVMEILRQRGVRLIAINDGVDSLKGDDDFTPFRNIMNEFYARDTSRKIRSVFKSKGMSGKHLTGTVIYGYGEASRLTVMNAALDRIEAVLDEPELPDTGKQHLPSQAQPGQPEVQFSDVAFAYQDKEVLHHINFAMKKNSMTALVGPSGGGKSTIANLLARLWDVKSGSVTIRGVDIRNVPLSELMDQISMVFQRVYLFQDTIYNNISMGKPDATEEEVYEAAKKARCYDFIMALPDGFQTVVGEGGATLSGGEKQRISIARCILKDAPIVILDEATASVDTDNESYIQEAISELVKGKTLLVIAHRLNTIQNADQILVIDNGQIAQHGTHEELLEQPGIYQDFVNIRKSAAGWSLV